MPRTMLTDEYWSKLEPILLDCRIYRKPDLRLTLEGILHKMKSGCAWRDVPDDFGKWNSIYKRFNAWSRSDKLYLVFQILSQDKDLEWIFIDGSIVKAHQHASGAAMKSEEEDHAIGRSVAALPPKSTWL